MLTEVKKIPFKEMHAVLSDSNPLRDYVSGKDSFFMWKRLSDVFISLIVLVVFFVFLFPIIALLIKLESRGPVFFIQRRVGKGGRSFSCYKLRTMILNEGSNTVQAVEGDSRITRGGAILRACNLDEFPQFINVLLGDMSIVGPRPHMHADCAKFSSEIRRYKMRNIVKPGITGLAQSKGLRGPTHDFTSMFHRYQFDAFYIRNANFWMDVRIVSQTALQTVKKLGAHAGSFFSLRFVQCKKILSYLF